MSSYTFISCKDMTTDEFVNVIKAERDKSAEEVIVVDITKQSPRFEDVKKVLYAGANFALVEDEKIFAEAQARFEEKIVKSLDEVDSRIEGLKTVTKIPFSEFKTNENGLVPCIAQDYYTGKVLMMAYMNEESYNKTLETGLMTYWSRSREKLWTKGEESGHFQHMLSLTIDCDKDTILAKVKQEGPACHTGNETCFFTPLAVKNSSEVSDAFTVLQDVYATIKDRKENPREGSYTNYLFDKGIDKILKKVGEECTEIVIAAKNPDAEEIKYEIADFLYHAMVLMVERGVTWEDITDELARRE